jgi:hypothetical protein
VMVEAFHVEKSRNGEERDAHRHVHNQFVNWLKCSIAFLNARETSIAHFLNGIICQRNVKEYAIAGLLLTLLRQSVWSEVNTMILWWFIVNRWRYEIVKGIWFVDIGVSFHAFHSDDAFLSGFEAVSRWRKHNDFGDDKSCHCKWIFVSWWSNDLRWIVSNYIQIKEIHKLKLIIMIWSVEVKLFCWMNQLWRIIFNSQGIKVIHELGSIMEFCLSKLIESYGFVWL